MQKIINVLAITSFVVSGAVVGGGFYLYSQKDAIIEDIKEKALENVLGGAGALGGATLPLGSNDLMKNAPQAQPDTAPQASIPKGSSMGLPVPGGF